MSKNLLNKLRLSLESGELFDIVDNSLATRQVLYKLGYSNKGQYVQIVNHFLLENDLDISHFTPNGRPLVPKVEKICPVCNNKFKTEPRKVDEQVTCSYSCSNTYFRTKEEPTVYTYRQRALSHYKSCCGRCGFTNILALEVHHKDRNRNNNTMDNLEVLCANCHKIEHGSG